MAGRDDYFKAAYNQLQLISQDESKRWEYEAREKALRDDMQREYEYEQRGIRKGQAEGKKEEAFNIAKKLLAKRFSLNDIADITGLTAEQIGGIQAGN